MGIDQVLLLRVRVDMEVIEKDRHSAFPRAPVSLPAGTVEYTDYFSAEG